MRNRKLRVHFKNGSSVKISEEIAIILRERITSGCEDFQIFSNINDNDKPDLFINLSEVTYIQ